MKWKTKTGGVDPVKFYAMTLYYSYRLGGHRSMSQARLYALMMQRPDLFLRRDIWKNSADAPAHIRPMLAPLTLGKAVKERRRLAQKLKNLMEKPSAALAPILKKVRMDFEKIAAAMPAADYVVALIEAKRLGLVPYTFAGTAKTIFIGLDDLKQIETNELEWKHGGAEYNQAMSAHDERTPAGDPQEK